MAYNKMATGFAWIIIGTVAVWSILSLVAFFGAWYTMSLILGE